MRIEKGSVVGIYSKDAVTPVRIVDIRKPKKRSRLEIDALTPGNNTLIMFAGERDINFILPGFEEALGFPKDPNQPK